MYGTGAGLLMLVYAAFCWRKQGIHTRYEGWKTREEAPKSFARNMVFYLIFALVLIATDAYRAFVYGKT